MVVPLLDPISSIRVESTVVPHHLPRATLASANTIVHIENVTVIEMIEEMSDETIEEMYAETTDETPDGTTQELNEEMTTVQVADMMADVLIVEMTTIDVVIED
jgi:hypothetical protein